VLSDLEIGTRQHGLDVVEEIAQKEPRRTGLAHSLQAERADNDARLAAAQSQSDTASAVADFNAATEAINLSHISP